MTVERSIDDEMTFEIRDLNLAYLLMVRRFARESIEGAPRGVGPPPATGVSPLHGLAPPIARIGTIYWTKSRCPS